MHVLHDPACAEYAAPGHPEAPFRVLRTAELLREKHPGWLGVSPACLADDTALLRAHTPAHLARLRSEPEGGMFDPDTAALPAWKPTPAAVPGPRWTPPGSRWRGRKPFRSCARPATTPRRTASWAFVISTRSPWRRLHAQAALGARRVAVWDFDAHHGNGTEDILHERDGMLYVSVHQYPGYPGTGRQSFDNVKNYPVAPGTSAETHLAALEKSWADVLAFRPDLILASAGFDAYAGDPITDMRLRPREFAALGRWMHDAPCPAGAILEGGYSQELPVLIQTFLEAWEGTGSAG